jgi:hypothetical protein
MRAAVRTTTGVSNTTVASRPSTIVVADAAANTSVNSRRASPPERSAMIVPSASNTPSRRHPSANSRSAARKPTVGAMALTA